MQRIGCSPSPRFPLDYYCTWFLVVVVGSFHRCLSITLATIVVHEYLPMLCPWVYLQKSRERDNISIVASTLYTPLLRPASIAQREHCVSTARAVEVLPKRQVGTWRGEWTETLCSIARGVEGDTPRQIVHFLSTTRGTSTSSLSTWHSNDGFIYTEVLYSGYTRVFLSFICYVQYCTYQATELYGLVLHSVVQYPYNQSTV